MSNAGEPLKGHLPAVSSSEPNHTASTIATRMDAVERLTALFKVERIFHLIVTSISLMVLLLSAGILLWKGKAGAAELAGLFGSSGLFSYSAGRLLLMWNQALKLLAGEHMEG